MLSSLPGSKIPNSRLRPLFTVGVSDIPLLKQQNSGLETQSLSRDGWIACTTDDVLSTKPDLYDFLVFLPPLESRNASTKIYPRIINSSPALANTFPKLGIKATQRDYHRYIHLLRGLRRFAPDLHEVEHVSDSHIETSSLSSHSSTSSIDKAVVEPHSWSRVAYTSLVWWASAGDRRGGFADLDEMEMQQDSALLQNDSDEEQIREVALIAYFHQMTSVIFETIAGAVERADEQRPADDTYQDDSDIEEEDDQEPLGQPSPPEDDEQQTLLAGTNQDIAVEISQDEVTAMGLDSWSAADKKFVEDLIQFWWGRKAIVRTVSVDCCGLRIL